jgi:hypothetical protein
MAQFLLYGFGPDADFEGQLVGALERVESGGALRILDVLFVRRDAASGEIVAVDLQGKGAGGVVGPLLGFRLDESERRRMTERALATGAAAELLGELGAAGANVIEVSHARIDADLSLDEVEVHLQLETRGETHTQALLTRLRERGYRVFE